MDEYYWNSLTQSEKEEMAICFSFEQLHKAMGECQTFGESWFYQAIRTFKLSLPIRTRSQTPKPTTIYETSPGSIEWYDIDS